jgi:alpha-ketoglutarate-dependent taurine dioxygenase
MTRHLSLQDADAYAAWRDVKLTDYPRDSESLVVPVADMAHPSDAELASIHRRIAKTNMALVRSGDPAQVTPEGLLALGRRLGLNRLDGNPCADARAVSHLQVADAGDAGEYVPYTSRPLGWHTDGYYNPSARQVRAWMLFCVRPAAEGGENRLLDHEIAYIRLRDRDPALIEAMMAPDACRIPANVKDGAELRPSSVGPVFSIRHGRLHMRYTDRTRSIEWRRDAVLDAAREALRLLFSKGDDYMFRHKLQPGEGLISNNVLHDRAPFTDVADAPRLLYRARYFDRVDTKS